jgi:hypothetical protein
MVCNNCLQEILAGESFWEDETEGTAYHEDCRQAALDRRNKAEEERDAALASVAELEAQAAQGWRPVTERPPADDEYLVWCSSYEGCEIQSYSKRPNRWYSNTGNDADYWRPLPPAPQETTP